MGQLQEASKPSVVAEAFVVTDVESPTRLKGRSGTSSYAIDMAYLIPQHNDCTHNQKACEMLSEALVGEKVWVQKEYSRYGVNMHTLWKPESNVPAVQSENIKLLMAGYGELVNVDARLLPNGKGKLVSTANEIGLERLRQKAIVETLPQWRLDNIADADAIDLKNKEAATWQVK